VLFLVLFIVALENHNDFADCLCVWELSTPAEYGKVNVYEYTETYPLEGL
jgi:hypothetical protein